MNEKKIIIFFYLQLTSIVEDSKEVEVGDVSMLLSRYFLFIARLHRAFNWRRLVGIQMHAQIHAQ